MPITSKREAVMKGLAIFLLTAVFTFGLVPPQAKSAVCADGVYRAGCAGPNGAVAVQKTPYYKPPVYSHPPTVTCANGVYRAGCAGPNGAAVVKKTY
jgi:hypothetical protein